MATKAYATRSEENNEGKGVSSCVGSKSLPGLTRQAVLIILRSLGLVPLLRR